MASDEVIGNMTRRELSRFVQRAITATSTLPSSFDGEEIKSTTKLTVDGDIQLSEQAVNRLKEYLGL